MPTKIELIYDAIIDIIEAALTSHKRLPNPYEITENAFLKLDKGFGVAIGPGVDTQRYTGCRISWQRSFPITIVRRMATTENNIGLREKIEKDILIDHDLIRKAFYADHTLNQNATTSTILDDSGVNFIDGDRLKFIAIELNLLVEYDENTNN
jgi:hypothetical protein